MAFFDQKHGLTAFERRIFWTLKNFVFIVRTDFVFLCKVAQHYFLSYFDQIWAKLNKEEFFYQKRGKKNRLFGL